MKYTYTTVSDIPERLILRIAEDLQIKFLSAMTDTDSDMWSNEQMRLIGDKMNIAIKSLCNDTHINVDGWLLTDSQINEIAAELRECRKIGAIKAVRTFTGSGLTEAKELIEKFYISPRNDSGPMSALNFIAAFGR